MNALKRFAFLIASSITLASCGGGGGGGGTSPPPPTQPTPVVSFVSTSVSPQAGAVGVSPLASLSVEFNTANADALTPSAEAKLTCSGNVQATFGTVSVVAIALPQGGTGKQWKASATPTAPYPLGLPCSGSMTVTVGGTTAVQNFSFTVNSVLVYTDKVYAIWTAASPYAVTKTGVKPVVNKTSYTSGNFPIFNCGIANKPLSDGKVLLDCKERVTLQARKFYIDPTKDEMYDYNGAVPADITFTFVQSNADKPEWGAKARVSDGWYFTTFDVKWVLKFQYDQGGAIITVKEGTFAVDGTVSVLASFSH